MLRALRDLLVQPQRFQAPLDQLARQDPLVQREPRVQQGQQDHRVYRATPVRRGQQVQTLLSPVLQGQRGQLGQLEQRVRRGQQVRQDQLDHLEHLRFSRVQELRQRGSVSMAQSTLTSRRFDSGAQRLAVRGRGRHSDNS